MDAQRRLGLAEATERHLKAQIGSAEQAVKALKEDIGKMRSLVNQTRAQCANEVRKREKIIEGLKKHVGEGGRTRGSGKTVGAAVINVTAGIGAKEAACKTISTDESGYDLRMETNEFLTELARSLSEENENLISLFRRTVDTLATLSGWEREGQEGVVLERTDPSHESLVTDIDSIVEHLRVLLTNPSFVPLEEVEIREDEIIRLREGWEKMEARWREAVQMMDGWRKRMATSGQTVDLEELRMGLKLSPVKVAGLDEAPGGIDLGNTEAEHQGDGDIQADIDAVEDSQDSVISDPTQEQDAESDEGSSHDELSEGRQDTKEHMFRAESSIETQSPAIQPSPFIETAIAGNRRDSFTTIAEENTWDLDHLDQSFKNAESAAKDEECPKTSNTDNSPQKRFALGIKSPNPSCLPRPAASVAQQSPLTMASIAAKLAATEREADAARVRAKLKAAKLSSATFASTTLKPRMDNGEYRDPVKEDNRITSPNKKRKAISRAQGGRASRRRSTLSPRELESLILGTTALSPKKGSRS